MSITKNNLTVRFYDHVADSLLKFAVIVSRHEDKWVFCRHKDRDTYEIPGGHREEGEDILSTAKRELWEETGAETFDLTPVCVYSMTRDGDESSEESHGMVYYADVYTFGALPPLEIAEVYFMNSLPTEWTYPQVHPKIINRTCQSLGLKE